LLKKRPIRVKGWQPKSYSNLPLQIDDMVLRRDKGICRSCGVDTLALHAALKYVFGKCEKADRWEWWPLEFRDFAEAVGPIAKRFPRRLYDIDHIEPLGEYGSDDMDNLQTLCVPCHQKKHSKRK
jgi:5-methylcytosine-specific restriction endonuclease McrA